MEQWSKEKIWQWYNDRKWFRGCNFLPSDCCNRIAFWQELDFEKHLETADRELALAASIGYNTIRVLLELVVWIGEHDSFMERFERFLQVADKHGISLMVCFGNDCTVPRDEKFEFPSLGEQKYDWGYHGGRKNSPHSGYKDAVGYNPYLDDPEMAENFYAMVREFVGKYADDQRICIWDLFNEAGNGNRGDISEPYVRRIFAEARAQNPSQPLTSGIWHQIGNLNKAEYAALTLSDIISYHNYGPYEINITQIADLRQFGRPLLNTEWMSRISRNTVQEMFPLFFLEKVGCWNWGFVAGLSQTYEPHESMWRSYDSGTRFYDFRLWMHDLFRPNGRPYDPAEIELITKFCNLADEQFENAKNGVQVKICK